MTSGEHFLFAAALAVAAGGDSDDQQDNGREADDGEDLGELVHGGGLDALRQEQVAGGGQDAALGGLSPGGSQ